MGHKVFVSYKYADDNVKNLSYYYNSTVRDYVDIVAKKLKELGHIYKGEGDNEDLSQYSDDTIWKKLRDRIKDSTATIVMISPNMVETNKKERDQWIPWEVSYSLKETHRENEVGESILSNRNAILAVVLPDENGSYEYYLEERNCCVSSRCTRHHRERIFDIIGDNMFNLKDATKKECSISNENVWYGECSYIEAVKWEDFIQNTNYYINKAYDRMENIDDYSLRVDL